MDNFYQINFLSRMTPDHPVPFPTVKPILAAAPADRFIIASTSDDNIWRKALEMSALSAILNDISNSTDFNNQKKEVSDDKVNLKHCKTIQCKMYLTQA